MRDQDELVLQVEDMRAVDPSAELIFRDGRILISEGSKRCIHGRALVWVQATSNGKTTGGPLRCAACDFELILLERRASERT